MAVSFIPRRFADLSGSISTAQVTGLDAALAAIPHTFADLTGSIATSQVTGLDAALTGKANLSGATFTGRVSCPDGPTSERLGASAAAPGNRCTAVGFNAVAGATGGVDNSIAVGFNASASGLSATAIGCGTTAGASSLSLGTSATASNASTAIGAACNSDMNSVGIGSGVAAIGNSSVGIGVNAQVTATAAVGIGSSLSATHAACIALGYGATTTAGNQLVLGGASFPITLIRTPSGRPVFEQAPGFPTMADSAAPANSLFLSSDHLDGNGDPKLCRKGASVVTVLG